MMSPALAAALKLQVTPAKDTIDLGLHNISVPYDGAVCCPSLFIGHFKFLEVPMIVANMSKGFHLNIGLDIMQKIEVSLPEDIHFWPDSQPASQSMAEDARLLKSKSKRWPDEDQLPSEECLPILAAIKEAITSNEALPVGQFCSHPVAVFCIPTDSMAPIFHCQYPIPHSLHPAMESQVPTVA